MPSSFFLLSVILTAGKMMIGNSRLYVKCGDGYNHTPAWKAEVPVITAQTTDPGVGSVLDDGKIVLVYE